MAKDSQTEIAEVSHAVGRMSDDDLANISSLADAMSLGQDTYGEAVDVSDYGSGFALLKDKRILVGVPFVIVQWIDNSDKGDYAGGFVSLYVVTEDGRKLIVNDGSTGIRDQLIRIKNRSGRMGNILCRTGLSVSDYEYEDTDGVMRPASTYYLAGG